MGRGIALYADRTGFDIIQNQRVQCKQLTGQIQSAILQRYVTFFFCNHQRIIINQRMYCVTFPEVHIVICHLFSRFQRYIVCVMSAYFIIHVCIAVIGGNMLLFQRIACQGIPYRQGKIKGIHGFGVIIGCQSKINAGICLCGAGKFQIPSKTMLGNGIFRSAHCIHFILQPSDKREQDRRMACPDGWICLPDIFYAGCLGPHGTELCALAVNHNGKQLVFNGILHTFSLLFCAAVYSIFDNFSVPCSMISVNHTKDLTFTSFCRIISLRKTTEHRSSTGEPRQAAESGMLCFLTH